MAFADVVTIAKGIETVKNATEISVAEKMKHLPQNIAKLATAKAGEKAVTGITGNDSDLNDIVAAVSKIRHIIKLDIKSEISEDAISLVIGDDQDLKDISRAISGVGVLLDSPEIKPMEVNESNVKDDTLENTQAEDVGNTSEIENYGKDVSDDIASDTSLENLKNPRQETVDGKTYYYDDNGNLYRIDNELTPDTVYEINGYKYTTDDQGRIISAEGKLRMRDADYERDMENVRNYENQEYRETDDRGHLIAHQFGGSDRLENFIPQDAKINRVDFRNFELELAKEVKNGKEVIVKVEPIYEGDSKRPVAIVVTYSIDGEEGVRIFPNGQEE